MNVMPMTNVHMDTTARSAAIHVLLKQVRAEYAEMPGMSVTLMQAQRLWAAKSGDLRRGLQALDCLRGIRRRAKVIFVRA